MKTKVKAKQLTLKKETLKELALKSGVKAGTMSNGFTCTNSANPPATWPCSAGSDCCY